MCLNSVSLQQYGNWQFQISRICSIKFSQREREIEIERCIMCVCVFDGYFLCQYKWLFPRKYCKATKRGLLKTFGEWA